MKRSSFLQKSSPLSRGKSKPFDFESDFRRHSAHFVGRGWVFKAIHKWLDDPVGTRVFWIVGDPGLGKSAIAAELASRCGDVGAIHFCREGNERRADPRAALTSIAYQLATQIPEYMQRVGTLNLGPILGAKLAQTVFEELIVAPLASTKPVDRPLLVVVDALDEAKSGSRNELADLIGGLSREGPMWLRFVVTSRYRKDVTVPLQDVKPFRLARDDENNVDDLGEYVDRVIAPLVPIGSISAVERTAVLKASEGLFLYLVLLADQVRRQEVDLTRPDTLPKGLGHVLLGFFRRQFPNVPAFVSKIRAALELVAAASASLSIEELSRILGWTKYTPRERLDALGPLFAVEGGVLRPFHTSVVEWLTDEKRAGPYHVLAELGDRVLAEEGLRALGQGSLKEYPYLLGHLPRHLERIGRREDAASMLDDLALTVERLAAGHCASVLADYQRLKSDGRKILPLTRDLLDVVRMTAPRLREAGRAGDVVSILEVGATRLGRDRLIEALHRLGFDSPLSVSWSDLRLGSAHQVIGDFGGDVIAVGDVDARTLLVAGTGGTLAASDAVTGARMWGPIMAHLREIRGDYAGGVEDVSFASFEPALLVACGSDQKVSVRNASSGSIIRQSNDLGDRVYRALAVEKGGQTLVLALLNERLLYLDFEALEPMEQSLEIGGPLYPAELRRWPGVVTLAGVVGSHSAQLWDALSGEPLVAALTLNSPGILAAAVVDGAPALVAAEDGHELRLSTGTGGPRWVLPKGIGPRISCLRVDLLDGRPVLMIGANDGSVLVWDLEAGHYVYPQLTGHSSVIQRMNVAEIQGERAIVSSDLGGKVHRWYPGDVDKSAVEKSDPNGGVVTVGQWGGVSVVVSLTGDSVDVRNLRDGSRRGPSMRQPYYYPSRAFVVPSPEGAMVVAGYWNGGLIFRWLLDRGELIERPLKLPVNLNSMQLIQTDEGTFAVGSGTDSARSYVASLDLFRNSMPFFRQEFPGGLLCAARIGGDVQVFTVGPDGLRCWDHRTGAIIEGPLSLEATGHVAAVELVVSNRSLQVVFASSDGLLWSVQPSTGATIARLPIGRFPVLASGTLRGRLVVAAGDVQGEIRVWDPADWSSVAHIDLGYPVRGLALGADRLVVSGERYIVTFQPGAC
jgi:WD40 repeat protein